MNIFKKISLINRILKLVKDLKKHFDKNTISDKIRNCMNNLLNDSKELGELVPECKEEINTVIELVKKDLKIK